MITTISIVIALILAFVLGYLTGRKYSFIATSKLSTLPKDEQPTDVIEDTYQAIKETIKPTRSRIISPSKRKATNMSDLEKDVI